MFEKLSAIIGVVVILVFGYFAFNVVWWLIASLKDIDPSVGAAMIAGVTTIITSVYIASHNSRKAKERTAYEAHREKKAETYNEFMSMVIKIMKSSGEGEDALGIQDNDLQEFFYKFTSKIVVYGGPGVVIAYADWRNAADKENAKATGLMHIDRLFREMRNDLGESNKGIDVNELLGLFIIGGKAEVEKITADSPNK